MNRRGFLQAAISFVAGLIGAKSVKPETTLTASSTSPLGIYMADPLASWVMDIVRSGRFASVAFDRDMEWDEEGRLTVWVDIELRLFDDDKGEKYQWSVLGMSPPVTVGCRRMWSNTVVPFGVNRVVIIQFNDLEMVTNGEGEEEAGRA